MGHEPGAAGGVRPAVLHPAAGGAAGPVALALVDRGAVTTLAGHARGAPLTGGGTITPAPLAAGTARAPQFEPERTNAGLIAGHGFSALVTVRRGNNTTSVLSDTGASPDAVVTNGGRLGLDLSALEPPRSRRKPGVVQRSGQPHGCVRC